MRNNEIPILFDKTVLERIHSSCFRADCCYASYQEGNLIDMQLRSLIIWEAIIRKLLFTNNLTFEEYQKYHKILDRIGDSMAIMENELSTDQDEFSQEA